MKEIDAVRWDRPLSEGPEEWANVNAGSQSPSLKAPTESAARAFAMFSWLRQKSDSESTTADRQRVGTLRVLTGKVLIGDPRFWVPVLTLENVIKGKHAVYAHFIDHPPGTRRVAALEMTFMKPADGPLEEVERIEIESGRMVVLDSRTHDEHWVWEGTRPSDRPDDMHDATHDPSGTTEEILKASLKQKPWCELLLDPRSGANVLGFATGFVKGVCKSYANWENRRPAKVVVEIAHNLSIARSLGYSREG
jgi:hypothetical protein